MKIFAKFVAFLLKVRYKVDLKNLESIDEKSNYLVLPNHVAWVDPVIIRSHLRPYIKIRPVVTSDFSKNPALSRIFKLMQTVTIEEMDDKAWNEEWKKVEDALWEVSEALKNWDSILLYPSWRIMGQWKEYIWWKKSAYLTVQNLQENTKVLTVRTTWLWGSRWWNAWNGKAPSFIWNLFKGLWFIIANIIFFIPKRKITIELLDQTKELKKLSNNSLEKFNQCLEDFYNKNWEEKVSYVPYYFYYNDVKGRKLPKIIRNSIESFKSSNSYDISKFPKDTINTVIEKVKSVKELWEKDKVSLESNLILDLYFDSLDMSEIKNLVTNAFPGASNTPISELKTVADLVAMALWETKNQNEVLKDCNWNIKKGLNKTRNWDVEWANNVLELFKKQRKADKSATQIYDTMFWLQTRKDVVLKAFLISDYLKKIPWKHIGIMFPALSSTSMIILATYLAEKIPVMMNWTHPESAFDHCVKFSKTKKILTSKTFFKTINIEWLNKYEFIFLEDLLKDIPFSLKIKSLIKSLYFPIPKELDETGVVLYTSGSESLPKAVPLSHKNLIAELKGALWIINIHNDEIFFSYLPPFHSFGFTVNTIFPLIWWMRSVNTPDPNDSVTVAKLIAHTKPTILATTPTFLKNLLSIASPKQLTSIRYVITWWEKCSDIVFEKTREIMPKATILEWYGITECAPIISINTIEKQKPQSVGISIKWGNIKILDINNEEELSANKEGMIYYEWDNVFRWYEDKKLESPFLKKDWKTRYKTGDLWYLDEDNFLFITWRMKRFLKVWWEMISLPFIEELLQEKYWSADEINLAIEWKEFDGWIKIVLFVVGLKLTTDEVNKYLKEKWVSNLIQINEIKNIESIPLLWTWKIDYKILKEQIN